MIALVRRQLVTDAGVLLLISSVIVVLAFVTWGAPRWLTAAAGRGIVQSVAQAGPLQRDLSAVVFTALPAPSDPSAGALDPVRQGLGEVVSSLDPVLAGRLGPAQVHIRFDPWRVIEVKPVLPDLTDTALLSVTVADSVSRQVRFVRGKPPGSESSAPQELAVAVSERTAHTLGLDIGSSLTLHPDGSPGPMARVRVTGIFTADTPDSDYWAFLPRTLSPQQNYTSSLGRIDTADALIDESQYARALEVLGIVAKPTITVRLAFDPTGLRADDADPLLAELRYLSARQVSVASSTATATFRLNSGLVDLVEAQLRTQSSAARLVTVPAAALLPAGLGVLILSCGLLIDRRRAALRLLAARGASAGQTRRLQMAEAILVVGLSTGIGVYVAQQATSGPTPVSGWILTGTVIAAALAAMVLPRKHHDRIGWVGARLTAAFAGHPGLAAFLGVSQSAAAGRHTAAGRWVLGLAVLAAVAGTVLSTTATTGVQRTAALRVGADAKLTSTGFTDDQLTAARADPDVVSAATLASTPVAVSGDTGSRLDQVTAVLTRPDIVEVQRDLPGAPEYPAGLWRDSSRLPVLVWDGIAAVGAPLLIADGARRVPAVVVGTASGPLPTLVGSGPWLVADADLALRHGLRARAPTTMLLAFHRALTGDEIGAAQQRLQIATDTVAPLLTRRLAVEQVLTAPLVERTLQVFPIGAGLAGVVALLAVALSVLTGARQRFQVLARLRTLGLTRGQALAVTGWEVLPGLVVALLVGALAGVTTPIAVLTGLDLQAFVGSRPQPTINVGRVAEVLGVLVAATVTALLAAVWLARRAGLDTVLRVGGDP